MTQLSEALVAAALRTRLEYQLQARTFNTQLHEDLIAFLARAQERAANESGREEALKSFTEWFRQNYPGPDTVICKPDWHAPKIFRAVEYALKSCLQSAPCPHIRSSDEGTQYCELAQSGAQGEPVVGIDHTKDGTWVSVRIGNRLLHSQFYASPPARPDDVREALYQELIMAVASKYPGETRHQTALRYINQTEGSHSAGSIDAARAEKP